MKTKRFSPFRRTHPKTRLKLLSPGDGGIKPHQLGHALNRHISGLKPDLAAPGVEITAPVPGGGYGTVTGTSFAAPFVTGSAALLMEWGIVRRNDPFLWGEKVKAYLRRGAQPLPGFNKYPDNQVGYGTLCVGESIPK